MELGDLIDICRAWTKLGWAVQEQAEAGAAGEPMENQNPNALAMVQDWLTEVDRRGAFLDDPEQLRDSVTDLGAQVEQYLQELRQAA